LDDRENALDLHCLPQAFAKSISAVLSLAPGNVANGKQK
jgi:hypothetical protein